MNLIICLILQLNSLSNLLILMNFQLQNLLPYIFLQSSLIFKKINALILLSYTLHLLMKLKLLLLLFLSIICKILQVNLYKNYEIIRINLKESFITFLFLFFSYFYQNYLIAFNVNQSIIAFWPYLFSFASSLNEFT